MKQPPFSKVNRGRQISVPLIVRGSARPNPHNTILPTFSHIPILKPQSLHSRRIESLSLSGNPSTTIPMAPIRLVIYFRHGFAGRGGDTAGVKHHACNWVVVGECVVDGAGAEVPYLMKEKLWFSIGIMRGNMVDRLDVCKLTRMLLSKLPVTK